MKKLAPLSEPYKKQINLGHNIEENSEVSMKLWFVMKNLSGNHLNGLSLCLLIESCSQIWYDFLLYPILKQKH